MLWKEPWHAERKSAARRSQPEKEIISSKVNHLLKDVCARFPFCERVRRRGEMNLVLSACQRDCGWFHPAPGRPTGGSWWRNWRTPGIVSREPMARTAAEDEPPDTLPVYHSACEKSAPQIEPHTERWESDTAVNANFRHLKWTNKLSRAALLFFCPSSNWKDNFGNWKLLLVKNKREELALIH